MRVALIYDSTQVFTGTVRDHVAAVTRLSSHEIKGVDFREVLRDEVVLDDFEALIHHYSVRLCFPYYPQRLLDAEAAFAGPRLLFIQDEYDNVDLTSSVINYVGFDHVFSCVPPEHISWVYSGIDRGKTVFSHVLTGYVPLTIPPRKDLPATRHREVTVSYRGRDLGPRYGQLAHMKVEFGLRVAAACDAQGLTHSIRVSEADRLYGSAWDELLLNSKVALGTPSGSNVFDFDGKLARRVASQVRKGASPQVIGQTLVAPLERPGVMNQVSPRVFESIAMGAALCMPEGDYSGVLEADRHYFSVRSDYSNVDEVVASLVEDNLVEEMWERAYTDIIVSGRYDFQKLIDHLDSVLNSFSPAGSRESLHPEGVVRPNERGLLAKQRSRYRVAIKWQLGRAPLRWAAIRQRLLEVPGRARWLGYLVTYRISVRLKVLVSHGRGIVYRSYSRFQSFCRRTIHLLRRACMRLRCVAARLKSRARGHLRKTLLPPS